ncbi:hypothetical protein [uncultured Thiohalocapsa sp.]|uniref:hypothetical protein n=1 Tax=uncultured Thiohalocapsa sp. TaxID=768990 RepID=UPI0025F32AAD|nr:hypothetical protein [uncultured Thiohalocapsa sp.]
MPRREVAPPELPDAPFEALSAEEQARCVCRNLRLARKRAGFTQPTFVAYMRRAAGAGAVSLSYLGDIERGAPARPCAPCAPTPPAAARTSASRPA